MELTAHDLPALFEQLGLPSEPAAIDRFIHSHHPLPLQLRLCEAPFWTHAQATVLSEMLRDDSDWAVVVDTLNTRLRATVDTDQLPTAAAPTV